MKFLIRIVMLAIAKIVGLCFRRRRDRQISDCAKDIAREFNATKEATAALLAQGKSEEEIQERLKREGYKGSTIEIALQSLRKQNAG